MCVQVVDELKENAIVVLGPRQFNKGGSITSPTATMHIRPHRRLQGSGLLSVRTYADGPTRVLEIANVTTSSPSEKPKSETVAVSPTINNSIPAMIYRIDLRLEVGIGISVINSMGRESEELLYVILNDIRLEYKDENNVQTIDATIGTIIISNQLLMTSTPCLLYATYEEDASIHSAILLKASLQKPSANYK